MTNGPKAGGDTKVLFLPFSVGFVEKWGDFCCSGITDYYPQSWYPRMQSWNCHIVLNAWDPNNNNAIYDNILCISFQRKLQVGSIMFAQLWFFPPASTLTRGIASCVGAPLFWYHVREGQRLRDSGAVFSETPPGGWKWRHAFLVCSPSSFANLWAGLENKRVSMFSSIKCYLGWWYSWYLSTQVERGHLFTLCNQVIISAG